MKTIPTASIEVILRYENANTDPLAKLASTREAKLLNSVLVEFLVKPSIKQQPKVMELV